ncbi:MAG: haloalkane dehalogenase [Candidatus Marinimicrobia bacterium]|nr:haloalkane dehalogenase [Candidatus Neomarinimicrobiota bacterium]
MVTIARTTENEISPDFPYESRFIDIKGSKMHYIDEGEGDPILFLHGNPTSSYLWRNIIPYLSGGARCIAPDLIGMGKSDRPDLAYGFYDTYAYLDAFIGELGLKNITLVVHDWGSGLGFHYANLHRENIKAIAFMEAMYDWPKWSNLPLPLRISFKMMRTPFFSWLMINVANLFVNQMLPKMIVRKLSKEELEVYARPYPTIGSRKPIRAWPKDVPMDGKPEDIGKILKSYQDWLKVTEIPKLCLYATPGLIINKDAVEWIRNNFPNTKMVNVGEGLHYIQEDHPHKIGAELAEWYNDI